MSGTDESGQAGPNGKAAFAQRKSKGQRIAGHDGPGGCGQQRWKRNARAGGQKAEQFGKEDGDGGGEEMRQTEDPIFLPTKSTIPFMYIQFIDFSIIPDRFFNFILIFCFLFD